MLRSRLALIVPVLLAVSSCASSSDDAAPVGSVDVADSTPATGGAADGDVFAPSGSDDASADVPSSAASSTSVADETTTSAPPTAAPTTTPADTAVATSTTTTTTITSTTGSTVGATTVEASPATTTAAAGAGAGDGETVIGSMFDLTRAQLTIGTSVEGRPIVAERFGTIGGRRVLVTGVIHGNEDAGVQVVDELRRRAQDGAIPADVELWLVESMNPDGQAAQIRQNANRVDLNRNFPHEWGPIGAPGDSQYAGSGPASEPETRAMIAFVEQLRPDIALWYHQDANLIIPSTGRQGRIRARYAELTGLPLAECCGGGGVYTGIAATWARVTLADQEAVPFIVELPGGDLSDVQVTQHADAVLAIAAEG